MVEGIMIKLKEKPISCSLCPFACIDEKFSRTNGQIVRHEHIRCGASRSDADIKSCPIGQI